MRGHILELVISRASEQLLTSVTVRPMSIADHHSVNCALASNKPQTLATEVLVRNFQRFDPDKFKQDVTSQCQRIMQAECRDADMLTQAYCWNLRDALDQHAPQKPVVRRRPRPRPWYNKEVDEARDNRRYFEHLWRRTKLVVYRQYVEARNDVTDSIARAKTEFFKDNLQAADNKSMFRLVRSLAGEQKEIYPDFDDGTTACNKFAEYFTDKVEKIRTNLDSTCINKPTEDTAIYERSLTSFELTTEMEISKIVSKISKTCELDPLPAKQMKQCLQSVVPVITMVTNLSLAEGALPSSLKDAIVRPLIKKSSMDKDMLKNYRPVSNLPLLSKAIEKVVAFRLSKHLDAQNMQDTFQSAYRQQHSRDGVGKSMQRHRGLTG